MTTYYSGFMMMGDAAVEGRSRKEVAAKKESTAINDRIQRTGLTDGYGVLWDGGTAM